MLLESLLELLLLLMLVQRVTGGADVERGVGGRLGEGVGRR